MIKCGDNCTPYCDFCIHVIHDRFESNGQMITGGPIGCTLHGDQMHQEIADGNGCCHDFHCFLAKPE